MRERMNLNMEDLEMVNGGTDSESFQLALILFTKGYGVFTYFKDSHIYTDIDKIADFFESRGWNYIPSANGANLYVDNNGHRLDQTKVLNMLQEKKL